MPLKFWSFFAPDDIFEAFNRWKQRDSLPHDAYKKVGIWTVLSLICQKSLAFSLLSGEINQCTGYILDFTLWGNPYSQSDSSIIPFDLINLSTGGNNTSYPFKLMVQIDFNRVSFIKSKPPAC